MVAAASPYLLGSLADQHGLATAFALEPVLIGICLLLLWGGIRARHSTPQSGSSFGSTPMDNRSAR